MPAIRLLPFGTGDGPTNMAADEALLESASERGIASLRFYAWTEPTITLGYFQPASVVGAIPGSLPRVRRSTGGAAIVHHHELTYALALPDANEWCTSESWICRFHHIVRDLLADFGIESHVVICGEERKLGDVLCFLHQTPGDLLLGGSKIAGSAQRKRKGALLQHGSLLLARSEFAPMLAGINDFAPGELVNNVVRRSAAGRHGVADYVGGLANLLAGRFDPYPGEWTPDELRRTEVIRAEKYANPEWNAKR